MQYLLEIIKIIESSLHGDTQRVKTYSKQLIERLQKHGEREAADKIKRVLDGIYTAGIHEARSGIKTLSPVPVDSESRLALADESVVKIEDVSVVLENEVSSAVDEFVRYVDATDKLRTAGVGISPSLLMYGPPGCGKTELARCIAARLQLPLITARTDTLISSYLGSTAKNLRLLFDHVSTRDCILFLDEFDALGKLRDDRHELGELKRVVVSLLQNIDSIRGDTILLAATNHEHLLDPAIWRRFAYKVKINLPSEESREKLFRKFLLDRLKAKTYHKLAVASEGLNGSEIRDLCESAIRSQIISDSSEILDHDIFYRLLVRQLGTKHIPSQMIALAKEKFPSVFTHRLLAEIFDMSPGNITHILHKHHED